ncbi:MAG: NHL repeat-containing protein [Chromatiaceae bacterium]|nr:NHL repeat-containing protein [Chromatiaceae bacterium]
MPFLLCCLLATNLAADDAAAEGVQFVFERASDAELNNPHDIKLSPDGHYLYVADVGGNRVVVLDAMSLETVDSFGGGELSGTHDIDFDRFGNAYVADTHNGRIVVYRMHATHGQMVGEIRGRLAGPEGVLAHPNGMIYASGAWSNNVLAYQDGRVVHELGGLSGPHDVELAADGNIWLADAGNDRILLLSQQLDVMRELGGPAYAFDGVRYLDPLPDGGLLAADKHTHSVKLIAPDGTLLATLGDGRPGLGEHRFRTPEGVDSFGDWVWIADSGNHRIVRYRIVR